MPENTIPKPSVIVEPTGLPSTAWVAGAESGIAYKTLLEVPDWRIFTPTYEDQTRPGFDSVSCVTYSGLNTLEPQLQRLLLLGQIPADALEFLTSNKYLDANGKFNFSDRFSAIVDGTTANGNYMSNAPDSFRHDGLIPEWMLPFSEEIAALGKNGDGKAIKMYLNPAVITQEMRDMGKRFLNYFDIKYENIWYGNFGAPDIKTIQKHLLQAPLHFAATVCSGENQENVIAACGCGSSHARAILALTGDGCIGIFDSFYKGQKKLALDFCIPYLYKIVITTKGDAPAPIFSPHVFSKRLVPEAVRAQHAAAGKPDPANDADEIIALQKALQVLKDSNGKPYLSPEIKPVANFGPLTTAAVIWFQTDRKAATPGEIRVAQGEVGPKTRAVLNAVTAK